MRSKRLEDAILGRRSKKRGKREADDSAKYCEEFCRCLVNQHPFIVPEHKDILCQCGWMKVNTVTGVSVVCLQCNVMPYGTRPFVRGIPSNCTSFPNVTMNVGLSLCHQSRR